MISRREVLALGAIPALVRSESPFPLVERSLPPVNRQSDIDGTIGPNPTQEIGVVWSLPHDSTYGSTEATSTLLVASDEHTMRGLDLHTGAELWSRSQFPSPNSPMVLGDQLFGVGTSLQALDGTTGESIWNLEMSDWREFILDDDHLFSYNMYDQAFFRISIESGVINAQYPLNWMPGGYVKNDSVLFVGHDYTLVALDLESSSRIWELFTPGAPHRPLLHEDVVFTFTDRLLALNAQTGEELWHYAPGGNLRTAILADDTIFTNIAGMPELHAMDPRVPSLKWIYSLEGEQSHVIASNGVAYASASNSNLLHAIDNDTGELMWNLEFDETIRGLTSSDRYVIVSLENVTHILGNI